MPGIQAQYNFGGGQAAARRRRIRWHGFFLSFVPDVKVSNRRGWLVNIAAAKAFAF
jgi:hypothetical protein